MNEVYDELDALKAEIEKLKEECRAKKELSESLRKAHNEQLLKFAEANSLIEKQVKQLNAKSQEISEARQICEDLKSSLHEKELLLKQLNFATEKLQVEYGQKIQKLEGENKVLVSALDKGTIKAQDCQKKIIARNQEFEGLKRQLLIIQKKFFEAEGKAKISEELRSRDDVILKIEEENRNVHDKLKWKREQFRHLEEAHKMLQDKFHLSNLKWEREKSELFEEIGSLQTSLDSQTRISESRHSQLKMCNQALSHEESRRKILEVEVFELKSRFENVTLECQEAKSKIGDLTLKRDKDIAELRNALGTKETLTKEMEYRISHLEQDNQELLGSLKEFREAQIKNAGGDSSKKLQNRLRVLEQLHRKCSAGLEEKEAECSSQLEKMRGDMNGYASDLKEKENETKELQMELEGCIFLSEVQNEEISVVIMVLKSEFSAAYSMLFMEKAEMATNIKERGKDLLLLRDQLENKNSAPPDVDGYLEQEKEEGKILGMRVVSLDHVKHQQNIVQEELERHKKIFDELSSSLSELKEQVAQMGNALEKSSKVVLYSLERANGRLAKKILEIDQTKLELQKWKSTAEKLNAYLEGNQEVLRQEKERLLGIVKEQDENIGSLQQQIVHLESRVVAKMEAVKVLEQEKERYFQIAKNKDHSIENLRTDVSWLKQESAKRELERSDAHKNFKIEEERLLAILKEKDWRLEDLSTQVISLKQNFESAIVSALIEKQIEIDVLNEALEQNGNLKSSEIQDNNKTINDLGKEINDLRQKLMFQTQSVKSENQFLLEDIKKVSEEREDMLVQMEEVSNWIIDFSGKDVELIDILDHILRNCESSNARAMDLASDGFSYSPSMDIGAHLPSLTKSIEEC